MLRRLFSATLYVVAATIGLSVLVVGVLAYFVTSYGSETGMVLDGLGRFLEPAPFIAQFVFGSDRLWPGWGWFVIDLVWFWGGVGCAAGLCSLAQKVQR